MVKKFRLSVVIMRAQLPTLAHLSLIETAAKTADHVLVLLGSSNLAPSFRNPFNATQRREMLQAGLSSYVNMITHFAPLPDFPTEYEWEAEVLNRISICQHALNIVNSEDITILAHDKDDTSYYVHNFPQFKLTLVPSLGNFNATDARVALYSGEGDINLRLRPHTSEGVIKWLVQNYLNKPEAPFGYSWLVKEYQSAMEFKEQYRGLPYGINFITGDALVICGSHILLVQRNGSTGHNQWALPGGFKEPGEDIKKTIIRELLEETVIDVPKRALRQGYKGCDPFSAQGRDPRGDFTTFCGVFVIEPNKDGTLPKVRGSSDAKQATWQHIAEVRNNSGIVFADHSNIIETQLRKYGQSTFI